MPIYNLTMEKINELKQQEQDKETEYSTLNSKSPKDIWISELDILESEYNKWYELKIKENTPIIKKKKSKSIK
jgi:hypothetical protein